MAALYAGEGVSGWPFAVDGWRWIVSWSGLQATNGTYATDETYGGSRCQPPTANRQPLTISLKSVLFRNLFDAIDADAEIIDQAIL